MAIKGCKSIAEYFFRKWMEDNGLSGEDFSLYMNEKNEAIVFDKFGDHMNLIYDEKTKVVYAPESTTPVLIIRK